MRRIRSSRSRGGQRVVAQDVTREPQPGLGERRVVGQGPGDVDALLDRFQRRDAGRRPAPGPRPALRRRQRRRRQGRAVAASTCDGAASAAAGSAAGRREARSALAVGHDASWCADYDTGLYRSKRFTCVAASPGGPAAIPRSRPLQVEALDQLRQPLPGQAQLARRVGPPAPGPAEGPRARTAGRSPAAPPRGVGRVSASERGDAGRQARRGRPGREPAPRPPAPPARSGARARCPASRRR